MLLVRWQGTQLQQIAAVLSLIALFGAGILSWRTHQAGWGALAATLFVTGSIALLSPLPTTPVTLPSEPVSAFGMRLLGLQAKQTDQSQLFLFPMWQIIKPPPAELHVAWQLRAADGRVAATSAAGPTTIPAQPRNGRSARWQVTPTASHCRPAYPQLPTNSRWRWMTMAPATHDPRRTMPLLPHFTWTQLQTKRRPE